MTVGASWAESVIADMDAAFARDVRSRGRWWAYRRYWREALSPGTWRLRRELNRPLGPDRAPFEFEHFARHIISAERSPMVQTLVQDIRFAIRTLIRTPILTGVAILTLALGIGANSAIFSVVNGVILKPLEYHEPTELVFITSAFHSLGFDQFWMSAPEFQELREWSDSYLELGAYNTGDISIAGTDTPIRVSGAFATAELFAALGVPPAMGRLISPEDDAPGANPVFMLSHELWQRAFGSDPDIVGKTYDVGGTTRAVIGVMPPRFDIHAERIEAWVPIQLDPTNPPGRASHFLFAVGRLKPGVSPARARAEVATLLTRWEEAGLGHSPNSEGHPIGLEPLQEEVVGDVRPALLVLLGAVGFVLLIACANVGNLLLARAEARQKEIAVRTALGAARGRLTQQFLTESVVLSLVGGIVGLTLGSLGVKALLASYPDSIPRANEVAMDGTVLVFTVGVSVVAGLVFGLAPLLHLTVKDLSSSLQDGGQRTTAGAARLILRRGLVASELALAVILVIGAGLMLRSFSALQQVDPGFEVDNLLSFNISTTFTTGAEEALFLEDLRAQLAGLPGVTAVAGMSGLPPDRRLNANSMDFEGLERNPDGPPHNVDFWQFVSDDYFTTMGIPVMGGRAFSRQDVDGSLPVVMVNETMARTFWPDESPIGRRLRPRGGSPWLTVIGVVKDVKQQGMDEETGTELYFYKPQVTTLFNSTFGTMNFVARTTVPPLSLARSVRETVWSLDATLPVADVLPMERVIFDSVARPRFLTLLLLTFGGVALTLAALGTYGVMSYTVAERTQEMGIRMALGAQSGAVIGLVLRQGLLVAGIGLVIGTAGAVGLTKLMSSILFGVSATDVATFAAVPLILLTVAAVACLVPALRATQVDPVTVLKAQ
jgi:putative ABC transport system permease protein